MANVFIIKALTISDYFLSHRNSSQMQKSEKYLFFLRKMTTFALGEMT